MVIEIHWFFLIPLLTALVAIYITHNSDTEISYLTGAVTVFSLILSLILAPWELQLLILMVVIVWSRQLWLKGEKKNVSETEKPEKKEANNLVSNESSNFSDKNNEDSLVRKYRGISWKKQNSQPISAPLPKTNLKYRGIPIDNQQNDKLPEQDWQAKEEGS
jgi:membrane protein implicated in regulation of membrane protease activity